MSGQLLEYQYPVDSCKQPSFLQTVSCLLAAPWSCCLPKFDFFPFVFRVRSFVSSLGPRNWFFFLGSTLWQNPMVLCSQIPFLTFSGITTFVTRLNKLSLSWLNGLVTLSIVVNNCSDLLFTSKHSRCESMMVRHSVTLWTNCLPYF